MLPRIGRRRSDEPGVKPAAAIDHSHFSDRSPSDGFIPGAIGGTVASARHPIA